MPRRGPRVRVARGIYRDERGVAVEVCVNRQRAEKRYPLTSSIRHLEQERAALIARLRKRSPAGPRGTLARDCEKYETLIQHLASWKERRSELRAWKKATGDDMPRARISTALVLQVVGRWTGAGVKPKTINNRLQTLRDLYHRLDGRDAWTPVDEIAPLTVVKVPAIVTAPELVLTVLQNLEAAERTGTLRDSKTRARFLVRASTGKRPIEIMRAKPEDVDLQRRVWVPRDGKGGWTPGGLYLNDDMLAAWRLFVDADAWGPFETSAHARTLRTAGWPAGVRPYQLRHATWITASERGVDLSDIQAGAGHKRIETTRRHYVPVLGSRMQRMSETLDGRFGWTPAPAKVPAPDSGTTRTRVKSTA